MKLTTISTLGVVVALAAASLLPGNDGLAESASVNEMYLQKSHHFKLPAAAVVLVAPINVLNEVSGGASAVADTCTTVEECKREITKLRENNKNLGAEIKSLGAVNKALKNNFNNIAFGHGVNAGAAAITGALTLDNNTDGRRLQDRKREYGYRSSDRDRNRKYGELSSDKHQDVLIENEPHALMTNPDETNLDLAEGRSCKEELERCTCCKCDMD